MCVSFTGWCHTEQGQQKNNANPVNAPAPSKPQQAQQ
ncbi:hypothetical protein swp_1727 [Shewanella piezotolerans WP3]|uniref:Uncharacterized protein n=1 Tax=Shewanella piezotolerans (strain WP3 / JCM 13877) TaxID=225849 RepID=B8CMZ7_SHEPW|nr:hypothetical protein swp_1727 [Shewanella piezotolerans WP3]